MSAVQNLQSLDPFADARKGEDLPPAGAEDHIHTRVQQRNGWRTLTAVQGIADDQDKSKPVKALKRKSACTGTAVEHPEHGEELSGGWPAPGRTPAPARDWAG